MDDFIEEIVEPTPVYDIGILTLSDGQQIEINPITEGDTYIDYRRVSGKYKGTCTLQLTVSSEETAASEIIAELEAELVSKTKPGISLDDIKAKLVQRVNDIRYEKIYQSSIPYTFPEDTEPDGIQMRDEKDRQNLQDLIIDAMNNDPSTIMYFMPTSNNMKTVTSQDIIDMGRALKSRGDQIVLYAWNLKSRIFTAATTNELPNVENGWPE